MTRNQLAVRYRSRREAKRRDQTGFSMIEVLVSLLVMTIGLLGVAGLMLTGVNNATATELSSRATQSANQIMDAIRSNPANTPNYICDWGHCTPSTATTVASQDLTAWMASVTQMPGGDGKIEVVTGTREYIVSIRFDDCLGTLDPNQKANCASATSASTNQKRTLTFRFES